MRVIEQMLRYTLRGKFNIGILILTAVIWYVIAMLPYNKNNFDMTSECLRYITLINLTGLLVSTRISSGAAEIGGLSIFGVILSFMTMLFSKSLYTASIGFALMLPLSIFLCLLLLKLLWIYISLKK